ncbi:MAG: cobalt ECF transporter T component CbiQ [Planctomycetota bacterium]
MRQTFDLFSDIFARRDNVLRRMDPRAKLVIAVATILAVILSARVELPLAIFAACLGAMLAVRMPPRLIVVRLAAPMGIVLVLVVLQSLMIGTTPLLTFPLGAWQLTVMREGLLRGLLIGSRVLGAVSVVLLLSSVTPAYEIFRALRWFRVPNGWVEIAMLMYRYVFTLLDQTADVVAAQKVRLGYSTFRRSVASMGVLAGTVIVRSIDQATNTHEAMIARGYRNTMPFGPMPGMRAKDPWVLCLALLAVLSAYLMLGWRP